MLSNVFRFFYFPRYLTLGRADPVVPAHLERRWITTDQGRVEYWFLRAAGSQPRGAVLFSHGNGELIDDWPSALSPYLELGMHLVLVEFRGYGRSAGAPSEPRLVSDFTTVVREVAARGDVDARRIVYHGRSMGGGVVCAAATQLRPAHLVLQSTFISLEAMGRRFGKPRRVRLPDRFDNRAALTSLNCRRLIFHGERDRLVPVRHAHALHACRPELSELRLFADADHNSPIDQQLEYWAALSEFLRK